MLLFPPKREQRPKVFLFDIFNCQSDIVLEVAEMQEAGLFSK